MATLKKTILVLHSGGLDSTVCLLSAKAEGHHVVSLGVEYGQRHVVELMFARKQCEKYGIERDVINVEWQKPLRTVPMGRTIDEIKSGTSSAFLPGRNLLFFAIAAAHGAGIDATEVWTGINSVDYSGYPDCTSAFLESFQSTNKIANPTAPKFVAPLMNMTKPEIASRAKNLGLGPNDTWSCYRPILDAGTVSPCNQCDACKLHRYAWQGA